MKILLAQTRTNETKGPFIPFGQLVLAAHVEDIADVSVTGNAFDGTLPTTETIMEQVRSVQPDVVGITVCYAVAYSSSIDLARCIKEYNPEIRVLAGGHHATFSAPELLATGYFDAVFLGEGEASLREFVLKGDYRKIPGVVYLENGSPVETGRAPLVNLDEVRPPAYHLLQKGMRILLGAETSRGCPFKCDFCETAVFFGNRKQRKKSPTRVIGDLKEIVEATGGGNFLLMDDCFSADMQGHVKPICEALIAEDLPANFCFQARLSDIYKHQDLVPVLARAGFGSVLMGVETIHPETLKAMAKGATYGQEEIRHIIKLCRDHGMAFFAAICFGYPGETPEMVNETIDFLIENEVDSANITIATPVPGSLLYERAKKNNELLSNDLSLYDGTHRLLSTIPETTAEAVYSGVRKYYLRPDYISKNLTNAINPATAGWKSYAAAGAMSFNIATDKARPKSPNDWSRLVQGLVLVLQNYPEKLDSSYTGVVQFEIDSRVAIFLKVEGGRPSYVGIEDQQADFTFAGCGVNFLDILVWCPVDILSACVLNIVKLKGGNLKQKAGFIRWLSSAANILRWSIAMQGCVPMLRDPIEQWLGEHPANADRISRLFEDGGYLFLGNDDTGGMVIEFQNGSTISSVNLKKDRPEKLLGEIPATPEELERIIDGGIDLLLELLEKEIQVDSKMAKKNDLRPDEFFATLPNKFRPELAGEVDLLVQYVIQKDDKSTDKWCLRVQDRTLNVIHGEPPVKASASVTLSEDAFSLLSNGKASPASLFHRGQMFLTGLPQTVIRMAACFENIFGRQE